MAVNVQMGSYDAQDRHLSNRHQPDKRGMDSDQVTLLISFVFCLTWA